MKTKLADIVEKQTEASTKFWAGKPKLSMEELSAVENFAKQKGEALEQFLTSDNNADKLNKMFKAASSSKK